MPPSSARRMSLIRYSQARLEISKLLTINILMKYSISILLFFFVIQAFGQLSWEVFAPLSDVREIEFYNNKAYVASNAGLLIVDLNSLEETLFTPNNSGLPGINIEEIEILHNGKFWLNLRDGGLVYNDTNSYTQILNSDQDWLDVTALTIKNDSLWMKGNAFIESAKDTVIKVYEDWPATYLGFDFDTLNNLWIAEGQYISNKNSGIVAATINYPELNGYDNEEGFYSYFIDNKNNHWLHSYENRVIGPANFETFYHLHFYNQGSWRSLSVPGKIDYYFFESDTPFSFSVNDNYCEIEGESVSVTNIRNMFPLIPNDLKWINIVAKENNETFWITGTNDFQNSELYRINSDTIVEFGLNSFLVGEPDDIAVDCNGGLICVGGDLQVYINNEWSTLNIDYTNEDCRYINEIEADLYSCNNWASSHELHCNTLWRIQDSMYQEYNINPLDICSTLTFDKSGKIFIDCDHELYMTDALGTHTFLDPPKIKFISDIHYSTNEVLWVVGRDSTNSSIILSYEENFWTVHNHEKVFAIDLLYEDFSGDMWLLDSDDRIYKYDGLNWAIFTANEIIDNLYLVESIVVDKKENIWIGTTYSGLYKWDGVQSHNYNMMNSDILSNSCKQLELASDSILWIRHNNGLSKMHIDKFPTTIIDLDRQMYPERSFLIYPNPTHSKFTVSFSNIDLRLIEIIDYHGKIIASIETSQETFEFNNLNLSSGCYFVRVISHDEIASKKIVVY